MTLPSQPARPTQSTLLEIGDGDWVGQLPGLGTVIVRPDCTIDVELVPDAGAPAADATKILREDWGALLASMRAGWVLLTLTTMCEPQGQQAIALQGFPAEVKLAKGHLQRFGWTVVSDGVTSVRRAETGLQAIRPAAVLPEHLGQHGQPSDRAVAIRGCIKVVSGTSQVPCTQMTGLRKASVAVSSLAPVNARVHRHSVCFEITAALLALPILETTTTDIVEATASLLTSTAANTND